LKPVIKIIIGGVLLLGVFTIFTGKMAAAFQQPRSRSGGKMRMYRGRSNYGGTANRGGFRNLGGNRSQRRLQKQGTRLMRRS